MDDLWKEVGVGGIFALLCIRMVFDFVSRWRARANGNGESAIKAAELRRSIEQSCEFRNVHGQILERLNRIEGKVDGLCKRDR